MSIGKLTRAIDRINVVKSITYLILRLSNSFNMKQKFTEEQASVLALDLSEIFVYETLEDVVLMFKYARQGKFSKTFERLDSEVVTRIWVPEYLELKAIERENIHNQNKGKMNSIADFKWSKEDVEKFEVDEKLVLPTKLSERMKEKLNVEEVKPVIVLKDRQEYLTEMYYQVRKMTDKQLQDYLVKCDVKKTNKKDTINYDEDVFKLVESEIDRRNVNAKQ